MPPLLILVLLEWVKGRKQAAVKLAGSPASRDSVSEERKKDLVSTIADNFAELSVEDGCGRSFLMTFVPFRFTSKKVFLVLCCIAPRDSSKGASQHQMDCLLLAGEDIGARH
ncbi:hypothetical protein MHU86_2305 [Fragilaria crotonensis]|nr:hypothetical protein MHU86_2305 [Fragilaria crotonensis]